MRRQRKELSYQREQRPPEEAKQAAVKTRPEIEKTSTPSKPVRTEASVTSNSTTTTTHAAAASPNGKGAQSSPAANRSQAAAVAFGRTTHLPPPQRQRQTKSAPLHRVRAGSAENLSVSKLYEHLYVS